MTDTPSPAVLVDRISAALRAKAARISVAESCTGGWIAKTLTDVPGSSAWFEYGFVCYGNNAKQDMLNVPAEVLERHGAVSRETAEALVAGALAVSGADAALAVTGIAGPDGGTVEKPVGTVWFAWGWRGQPAVSRVQHFNGDRDQVRHSSLIEALNGLLEILDVDSSD